MKTILLFTIADKEYAAEISQIKKLVRVDKVIPIPDTAEHIKGVINLQGKVMPLIDLRKKFNIDAEPEREFLRVIVVKIDGHFIGMSVDSLVDVVSIDEASIDPPGQMLQQAAYLTGIVRIEGRVVLLVDIKKLLYDDTQSGIQDIEQRVEIRKK